MFLLHLNYLYSQCSHIFAAIMLASLTYECFSSQPASRGKILLVSIFNQSWSQKCYLLSSPVVLYRPSASGPSAKPSNISLSHSRERCSRSSVLQLESVRREKSTTPAFNSASTIDRTERYTSRKKTNPFSCTLDRLHLIQLCFCDTHLVFEESSLGRHSTFLMSICAPFE